MKKILTIGGAMQDIFLQYESVESVLLDTAEKEQSFIILEEGRKIDVDHITHHTGGGATNSAISFKKLTFDVESFFKIGYDEAGRFILETLQEHEIDLKHVVRSEDVCTGTSFIIPTKSGSYAILVYRGANLTLKKEEISEQAIQNCDQLYITSLSKDASQTLPLITSLAKKHNKPVATNPGTSQLTANIKTLQDSLPNINILILNCYEAHLLMCGLLPDGIEDFPQIESAGVLPKLLCAPVTPAPIQFSLVHYFKEILKAGPHIAVVTNGAEGVYVTDGVHIYFHPSIPAKKTESSLGAGDAFGSTFVSFLAMNHPLEDAVRAGIINSASVIQHLDTTSGLLTKDELEKEIHKLDKRLLQRFDLK